MSNSLNLKRIEELVNELIATKAAEAECICARINAENCVAALVPTGDVGQKTVTLPGGQKITVRRGLNYKADVQAIQSVFNNTGTREFLPLKTKTTIELDEKGYEWYRSHNPELFNKLSQHVAVTPKKVAVSLSAKK